MKNRFLPFLMVLLMVNPLWAKVFGDEKLQAEKMVPLAEIMKNFEKYNNKVIATQGKVTEVCTQMGCWLKMYDGDAKVRVIMKDHGFKVPQDLKEKTVKVIGYMEHKEMPAKVIQHYMKDEGRPQKEIDQVKSSQKMFQFTAESVTTL